MNVSQRRQVICFGLIAILSGWIGRWIDLSYGVRETTNYQSIGMFVWLFLPALTVVFIRLFRGEGFKSAGLQTGGRPVRKWYIIAALTVVLVCFAIIASGVVAEDIILDAFQSQRYVETVGNWLTIQLTCAIVSESLWRGYLTRQLVRMKLTDFQLYGVVGTLWALWYLPYYDAFLFSNSLREIFPVQWRFIVGIFIIVFFCLSVFYVEIYRVSRSIWPTCLAHLVQNSVIAPLFAVGYIRIRVGAEYLFSPFVGIVAMALYLVVGVCVRQYRLIQMRRAETQCQ